MITSTALTSFTTAAADPLRVFIRRLRGHGLDVSVPDRRLFPVAGQEVYYLHGTRVPRFTFNQPNGKSFVIIGEATGPANIYVQRATLNGRPLAVPRIHHADIAAGGTLRFVMGPRPSAWGTGGEFDASQAAREVASAER